jgi:neuronal growth regulator 1
MMMKEMKKNSLLPRAILKLQFNIFFLYLLSSKMTYLRTTRSVLFLFAFSQISQIVIGQRSPSITYISENQSFDLGATVELACSVQYGQDYAVIWLKRDQNSNDSIYLSTGTSLVVKESRFALLYDGASATYIVLIKDLQAHDAGTYICEVVLSVNNKISAETVLTVRQPPIITDNSTQAVVTSEGHPVQLDCFAEGFPTPRVFWRRENSALLPSGNKKFYDFFHYNIGI